MRIFIIIILLLLPWIAQASSTKQAQNEIQILISFEGKEAVAVLADNATSQSFVKQLPVTVNFSDFAGAEKIAYLAEKLTLDPKVKGYDPELGDLACYAPWGNFIVFYRDQPYSGELIYIGKLKSGVEDFAKMNKEFPAKIEQIKE